MDFIEIAADGDRTFHMMLSFAIAGAVFAVLAAIARRGKKFFARACTVAASVLAVLCAFGITGAVISMPFSEFGASGEAADKRIALVKDEYGITLTDSQFRALSYPYEKPGEGRFLYGETDVLVKSGGDLKTVTVQLAWDEDHFLLMDTRTTPGIPLPTE